jgi:palmitoyltransferase
VLLLFGFIWHSVVFATLLPWFEGSVQGVTHIFAFSALTATALLLYLSCVFTDAGRVPPDWIPDTDGAAFMEVKKKVRTVHSGASATSLIAHAQGGEARYCTKCQCHKPPRTHHCRHCDRCILRMDHHCSWVNNCIGQGNYRAFVQFLICAWLRIARRCCSDAAPADVTSAVLYGLVLMISRALGSGSAAASAPAPMAQTVASLLSVPLVIMLATLLCWHLYLIAGNRTTVEYHEGVRTRRTAQAETYRRGDVWQQSGRHVYDVSFVANVRQALGSPLYCLVPGRRAASGDGLRFPTWGG